MKLAIVVVLFAHGFAVAAPDKLEPDDLIRPAAETRTPTTIDLPAVPDFTLSVEPGYNDPRELRVQGSKLLDTQVKVKGYIIWIYDCVTANAKPKQSRAMVQKLIDADPTLCERPKFYLGSTRDVPVENGLWVVDVPRPPNKLEKERLPKEELKAWPAAPRLKVGDYVVVTGDFKISSPHAERNSDGLVVYTALERAKPGKPRPKVAPKAGPPPTFTTATTPVARAAAAPMRKVVDRKVREASVKQANDANKLLGLKQFQNAAAEYRKALATWDGNHLAWYGLGGSAGHQGDWKVAADAFDRAAKLRPDEPMYRMWRGVALYEGAVVEARKSKIDLSTVNFATAQDELQAAISIEPRLWRAHFYLGRIEREQGRAKSAATSFSEAIVANPQQQGPYVALAELYRKWEYTDEAIQVALRGTTNVPGDAHEQADLFFVLGMAYDEKRAADKAIEALTRALDLEPSHVKAKFQRGKAYLAKRKLADAKRDLEDVMKDTTPGLEFARQQASAMLQRIDAKQK